MAHMGTEKAQLRLRMRKDVLSAIEKIAAEQNRSTANFIETELLMIAKRHGYMNSPVLQQVNNMPAQSSEDEERFNKLGI